MLILTCTLPVENYSKKVEEKCHLRLWKEECGWKIEQKIVEYKIVGGNEIIKGRTIIKNCKSGSWRGNESGLRYILVHFNVVVG